MRQHVGILTEQKKHTELNLENGTHNVVRKQKRFHEAYLIDDSLDEIKFSLQRRVQQQSQWVELHSHAVVNAIRTRLA